MSQAQPVHSDTMNTQDADQEVQKKQKSRRPANTAFRQQRLKAWQPILTPKTVLPIFFVIGILFAPIGALLLYASAQVQELIIDYSECGTAAPLSDLTNPFGHAPPDNASIQFGPIPSEKISSSFKKSEFTIGKVPQWSRRKVTRRYPDAINGPENKTTPTTICTLKFVIGTDLKPPVLFYYRLTNFYQNHRRYVKSLDTDQLKGEAVSLDTIKGSSCDPLRYDNYTQKPYYPCGLIANSLFNDTFTNPNMVSVQNGTDTEYVMNRKGIAWDSDKALYGQTKYNISEIAVPPNWIERYPTGEYTDKNPPPQLHEDEAFQVWMRTAGLPTFSKLAMRNDVKVMEHGMYQMDIEMNFPVTDYGGTKSIIISTRTVMGGKNPFLGIAYVVVGGICIVLGALFTITNLIKPRKLGDHTYLTWNSDQPSTAVATGVSRPGHDTA